MSEQIDRIFNVAATRGQQFEVPYAGALTPPEAAVLHDAGIVALVDVRTAAELAYVGRIPQTHAVEWQSYPDMQVNGNFAAELQPLVPAQQPLLFICRSGVRSHFAALTMAELGYQTYNVLEGFEGDLSTDGHRNTINGWRWHGLPWVQS